MTTVAEVEARAELERDAVRVYLARWGIRPTEIVDLNQHPAGMVYRANGDAGGDLYVITGHGPTAHFPVQFWHEGEPWRAALRWYLGDIAVGEIEQKTGYHDDPPDPPRPKRGKATKRR